jgi:hypothetical protein
VGLTVSAEEIINDKKILRREAFLNLSRFSYLLSKVGILAILSAIQVALFVWIGNSILQIKDMFLDYWIILFTSAVFANLLGLIISDTLKKTVNIYILIPFLIIPQLILSGVFVSYDRLNPNFSSVSDIPWYGELITARWSFEALAVNQFKNNNYMKEFFLYEKLKSNATYRKDYWYPAMKAELMKTASTSDSQVLKNNVALINNEFSKIAEKLPSRPEFEDIRTFKYTPQKEKSEKASQHLERIKNFYIGLYNEADRRHEEHRRALMREHPESGRFYLTQLRNHYHNEGLERFVRGTDDFFSRRIIRHNNRFVQKFDPVYKEPKHKFIKAHFLAPFKRVGNLQIETYRIDLIVLWAMNFILFILLYNKTLKKLLSKGKNHLRVKKPLVEQ